MGDVIRVDFSARQRIQEEPGDSLEDFRGTLDTLDSLALIELGRSVEADFRAAMGRVVTEGSFTESDRITMYKRGILHAYLSAEVVDNLKRYNG